MVLQHQLSTQSITFTARQVRMHYQNPTCFSPALLCTPHAHQLYIHTTFSLVMLTVVTSTLACSLFTGKLFHTFRVSAPDALIFSLPVQIIIARALRGSPGRGC